MTWLVAQILDGSDGGGLHVLDAAPDRETAFLVAEAFLDDWSDFDVRRVVPWHPFDPRWAPRCAVEVWSCHDDDWAGGLVVVTFDDGAAVARALHDTATAWQYNTWLDVLAGRGNDISRGQAVTDWLRARARLASDGVS